MCQYGNEVNLMCSIPGKVAGGNCTLLWPIPGKIAGTSCAYCGEKQLTTFF